MHSKNRRITVTDNNAYKQCSIKDEIKKNNVIAFSSFAIHNVYNVCTMYVYAITTRGNSGRKEQTRPR